MRVMALGPLLSLEILVSLEQDSGEQSCRAAELIPSTPDPTLRCELQDIIDRVTPSIILKPFVYAYQRKFK